LKAQQLLSVLFNQQKQGAVLHPPHTHLAAAERAPLIQLWPLSPMLVMLLLSAAAGAAADPAVAAPTAALVVAVAAAAAAVAAAAAAAVDCAPLQPR
jgi:hypothetical protein